MDHDSLQPTRPKRNLLERIIAYRERLTKGDRFLFTTAGVCALVFLILIITRMSLDAQISVPTAGGSYTEGIVGTPRFINPVLAVTNADKDLSMLIYDGLLRLGADGTLKPSVAESITVSEDRLVYNVILKKNITFHDDVPLTADDVLFTTLLIQDPLLQSPLHSNFTDVTVEKIGDYEINFILTEPYAPFIENLTFGILPKHIWKDAIGDQFPFSQHNSEPIGSGPYTVEKIFRNSAGLPESYLLQPFPSYHKGVARIETLKLNFYPNKDRLVTAYNEGEFDGIGGIDYEVIPELEIEKRQATLMESPLPRTFAVFFNQNKSAVLRDKAVREALSIAVDRTHLIETVLGGYALPITSAIPPGFGVDIPNTPDGNPDKARDILRTAGWKLNDATGIWEKNIDGVAVPLELSITTANGTFFEHTAEFLRNEWVAIGAVVTIKQFEQSDLTQSIIRPRDYESLLFGTALGRSLDFYSFWHSSQRNDPGLNVALYTNLTSDSILSEIRRDNNPETRSERLTAFDEEIRSETPAVFLFSPEYVYLVPHTITGISLKGIGDPSERFAAVTDWYIETESIWHFLIP